MGYSHERDARAVLWFSPTISGIEFIHQFDRERSEADDAEWPLRPVMDSAAEATEAHLAKGSVFVRIKPRAAREET
jgi:hypothetical protein